MQSKVFLYDNDMTAGKIYTRTRIPKNTRLQQLCKSIVKTLSGGGCLSFEWSHSAVPPDQPETALV